MDAHSLDSYQQAALTFVQFPLRWKYLFPLARLSEEIGELCEEIADHMIARPVGEKERAHERDEFGDVMWCCAVLAWLLGMRLSKVDWAANHYWPSDPDVEDFPTYILLRFVSTGLRLSGIAAKALRNEPEEDVLAGRISDERFVALHDQLPIFWAHLCALFNLRGYGVNLGDVGIENLAKLRRRNECGGICGDTRGNEENARLMG